MRKVRVINETPDSNPQLADKLSLLSDALHMDFELVEQESWIGHYNGDILPHDQRNDAAIVIEHHSDEASHYQLGQILASAENYEARILIWMADNIREEHRAALDWLNRWTPAEIEVYGVEIRNAEENDADANLKFVPVVAPASWSKCGESEHIPKIQSVVLRDFFRALVADLSSRGFVDDQAIVTKHDQSFPSVLSGMDIHASFETDDKVWVYIPGWPSVNNRILNKIRDDAGKRAKIETELDLPSGTTIDWKTRAGSIGVYRKATLYDSEEELEEIKQWMFHYLIKFKEVFNPRLKEILAELENSNE